jgi:hypothetical protein
MRSSPTPLRNESILFHFYTITDRVEVEESPFLKSFSEASNLLELVIRSPGASKSTSRKVVVKRDNKVHTRDKL